MFSPFRSEQGAPKALAEVTWADLAQLADLDEGYALEFKQTFSPTVRKKIPKIIASFANSAGGWIVVGIADRAKDVCPVPRLAADYGQIIGELARRHVTPTPRFDVRFLSDPANPAQGVVLVQVFEGDFPPYVADGVVEVREGSTSGPAAGSALVELYGKATRRRSEVRAFCRRTVYYAAPGIPLFDLYLFRMGRRVPESPSRERINAHADALRTAFARQGLTCRVQHAHDSLIFSIPTADDPRVPHSAIELFADESLKLSVPIVLLAGEKRAQALARLRALTAGAAGEKCAVRRESLAGEKDQARREVAAPRAEDTGAPAPAVEAGSDPVAGTGALPPLRLISAEDTLTRVTRMASVLDHYARERALPWQQYAVAYELENMAGAILWSNEELYQRRVAASGPLYCATTDGVSRVRYLDDGAHDSFRARQFAGSHFFEACGLPLGSPDQADNDLVDALLRHSR